MVIAVTIAKNTTRRGAKLFGTVIPVVSICVTVVEMETAS